MNYEQTLARLCALSGPSGFEENVTQAAAQLLRPLTDEVYFTRLGSVVGVRRWQKSCCWTPTWTRSALLSPAMRRAFSASPPWGAWTPGRSRTGRSL